MEKLKASLSSLFIALFAGFFGGLIVLVLIRHVSAEWISAIGSIGAIAAVIWQVRVNHTEANARYERDRQQKFLEKRPKFSLYYRRSLNIGERIYFSDGQDQWRDYDSHIRLGLFRLAESAVENRTKIIRFKSKDRFDRQLIALTNISKNDVNSVIIEAKYSLKIKKRSEQLTERFYVPMIASKESIILVIFPILHGVFSDINELVLYYETEGNEKGKAKFIKNRVAINSTYNLNKYPVYVYKQNQYNNGLELTKSSNTEFSDLDRSIADTTSYAITSE